MLPPASRFSELVQSDPQQQARRRDLRKKLALIVPTTFESCLQDSRVKMKGKSVALSKKYGVSPKTIRDIWNSKSWTSATSALWSSRKSTNEVTPVALEFDFHVAFSFKLLSYKHRWIRLSHFYRFSSAHLLKFQHHGSILWAVTVISSAKCLFRKPKAVEYTKEPASARCNPQLPVL